MLAEILLLCFWVSSGNFMTPFEKHILVQPVGNFLCPSSPAEDNQYELYTRNNPNEPVVLTNNNTYKLGAKEKNVVIIHGYLSSAKSSTLLHMKEAYLVRYDANVILMNWSTVSNRFYTTAVCKMRVVANKAADFFCYHLGLPAKLLHMVGHSLGAHMAGMIGLDMMRKCSQKLNRITGLDPAGPLFMHTNEENRLNSNQARFVDVIHTSEGIVGYYGNCGHVDFHVNCGSFQPECYTNSTAFEELIEHLSCDHSKSVWYMIESINSDNFIAQSCSACPMICIRDIRPEYIVMGEDCPRNSEKKVFWIPTRSESPYAAGCSLYETGCS